MKKLIPAVGEIHPKYNKHHTWSKVQVQSIHGHVAEKFVST